MRTALLSAALLAVAPSSAAAAEGVDRCGTITEISIGDLISGGFISIDGDKYLVGGVDPRPGTLVLPSEALAQVGARICFKGTVEPLPATARAFYVTMGTFTLQSRTLPSTSTIGGSSGALIALSLALIVCGWVLFTRRVPSAKRGRAASAGPNTW